MGGEKSLIIIMLG